MDYGPHKEMEHNLAVYKVWFADQALQTALSGKVRPLYQGGSPCSLLFGEKSIAYLTKYCNRERGLQTTLYKPLPGQNLEESGEICGNRKGRGMRWRPEI